MSFTVTNNNFGDIVVPAPIIPPGGIAGCAAAGFPENCAVLVTTAIPLALGSPLLINDQPTGVPLFLGSTYTITINDAQGVSDYMQLYVQDPNHYYAALSSDTDGGGILFSMNPTGPQFPYLPFGGLENGSVQDSFDLQFVDGHFDSLTFQSDVESTVPEPRWAGLVLVLGLIAASALRWNFRRSRV